MLPEVLLPVGSPASDCSAPPMPSKLQRAWALAMGTKAPNMGMPQALWLVLVLPRKPRKTYREGIITVYSNPYNS